MNQKIGVKKNPSTKPKAPPPKSMGGSSAPPAKPSGKKMGKC